MLQLSPYVDSLQRQIALAELRHGLISHNIANVNTPGFKALDFDTSAPFSTGESTSQEVTPKLQERPHLTSRADGNNVDIDLEIAEANKNALLYQTCLQLLTGELNTMRQAIKT